MANKGEFDSQQHRLLYLYNGDEQNEKKFIINKIKPKWYVVKMVWEY